jgi:hypothetical protein
MTTISSQQVLTYVLEKISKDFNIDLNNLAEKYGSVESIYKAIQTDIDNNKSKKKVIRKVSKSVEPILEEKKVEAVVAEVVDVPIEPPKKKVVRKITKNVEPNETVVNDIGKAQKTEPVDVPIEPPKKKVVRKVTKPAEPIVEQQKVVEVSIENTEEKVKPKAKRIIKKVPSPTDDSIVLNEVKLEAKEGTEKKSKKILELVEFGTGEDNSLDGCDELEDNIYVDTQIYNDEDSDSLEPREINGVKYYIDSSNYVYDNQDLIGKLNEKGDNIIFLSDFSN